MRYIFIIGAVLLLCFILFYVWANAFFGHKRVMRPRLDPNAILLINGVESPDSKLIIQEINSLRDQEWGQFNGKMSDTGTQLQIKNDPNGIMFFVDATHIEESIRNSNLSGGYMCGIQIENLPNLKKNLKKKKH